MTQMGLDYLKYSESVRSNRAQEALKNASNIEAERSNRAGESIKRGQLAEDTRHNMSVESLDSRKLAEQNRTNLANEGIKLSQLVETGRHNLETETQATKELGERVRSNKAKEAEDRLSHRRKEAIDMVSAGSKAIKHSTASSLIGAGIAGLGLGDLILTNGPQKERHSVSTSGRVHSSGGRTSSGRVSATK